MMLPPYYYRFLTGVFVILTYFVCQQLSKCVSSRDGQKFPSYDLLQDSIFGGNFDLSNQNVSTYHYTYYNDALCMHKPNSDTGHNELSRLNSSDTGYENNGISSSDCFHEPFYSYSKAEMLALKASKEIPDDIYGKIQNFGIAKRRRGRRAGSHTRKHIKVLTTERLQPLNETIDQCEPMNYTETRHRVLTRVPINTLRNPQLPSFLFTNPQSIRNKYDELNVVLADNQVSIVGIAETWHKNMPNDISLLDGYNCYRSDRNNINTKKSKGGGVAIFVRDHIKSEIPSDIIIPDDLEVLWVKLDIPTYKSDIYVACVYFPPKCKQDNLLQGHLLTTIDQLRASKNASFVIMGDFNEFDTSVIEQHANLEQVVHFPTHENKTLDKIMTDMSSFYGEPSKLAPLGKSKHCCISFYPNQQLPAPKSYRKTVRPVTDSAKRAFGSWITSEDWVDVYTAECPNEKASKFELILHEKYELHFPEKSVKRRKEDKPWITDKLKSMMKARDRAYKQGNDQMYKSLRNDIQREISVAKEKYYNNNIDNLRNNNTGKWHRHIKNLTGSKSTSTLNMDHISKDPQELAGIVNDHFASVCNEMPKLDLATLPAYQPTCPAPEITPGQVNKSLNSIKTHKATHPSDIPTKIIKEFAFELTLPLTHIFNSCLQNGIFPTVWKTSAVTPIPKVPNAKSLDKLRPISLTKIFGKIFEKFLADWVLEDFYPNIDIKQYGNMPNSSTTHYLVDLVDTVLKGIDQVGHYATLCTVDFTKAFDRINHNVAITKLIDVGVRRNIIPVITDFLTNRTQTVRIQGKSSTALHVWGGVPQGTNFGPIIFSAVANDSAINAPLRWKYVDDLTLGEIVCSKSNNGSHLQKDLDQLGAWCLNNDMLPKPEKCHIMHICNLKNRPDFANFTLNNKKINITDNMKLLGVTLQHNLNWDVQVSQMISKASKRIYMLYVLKRFNASAGDLSSVYQMYVRPVLEYASPLWHSSITIRQAEQIELIQKRVCRIILGSHYTSYAEALRHLNLMSLSGRREKLLVGFGQSLQRSERHNIMLPKSKNVRHGRNLRSSHQLDPPKCRTSRYRKSTIPSLVDHLNHVDAGNVKV